MVIFNKIKRSPSARAIGERMKTNLNRIDVKDLNISNGLSSSSFVELLRIVFKSGGASAYLPKNIVSFLNLDKESKNLIAFLDSEGPYNFIIITSDKSLSEMLKPLILQRRMRAEILKQKLNAELQAQQHQQTGTEGVTEVMH